jgi:putative nucleotidyltransferase with HDIG domain
MRQGGEAFRLGGDEFAVILPAFDEHQALGVAEAIVERINGANIDSAGTINVSAGVATYPHHSTERESLIRLADGALYWAKEHGKNQVRLARSNVAELASFRHAAASVSVDPAARFVAASSLARVVDSRDIYIGSHSQRVAGLAAELAERLGLPAAKIELVRLAGDLHDLGKLAIPEELLRKRDSLTSSERRVLERHPQIGYRMLQSLGAEAVARWVLHHHEHWDGTGYPEGLAGEQIPLGARIVHIAEALDAMTSPDRLYREPLSPEDAERELERGSGTRFDPHLVDVFLLQGVGRQELAGV